MRGALLTAALFGATALALLGARPLWLDEILQLIETTTPSAAQMLSALPRNAGAAPLGYIVQHAALRVTGYSVRRARLPAALFGIAAVLCVALLASRLGFRRPWIASALFALFPMTLRYATESRVYSQALFLSVLASLVFLRLSRQPNRSNAVACWLVLTAAAYTQPYSASIGLAHILWSATYRERRAALYGAAAFGGAVVAFLPWYAWAKTRWAATVTGGALHFSMSWKTPLLLFRELTGGGYWCAGLITILCAIAIARRLPSRRARALLVLMIAAPLACIFAADATLDYFFAARQFLWILPAVAVLAAAPLESSARAPAVVAALAVVFCVAADVRYFSKAPENWAAAADVIAGEVTRGACFATAPEPSRRLYEFFKPELKRADCEARRMVLAVTPYTTKPQRDSVINVLTAQGYHAVREMEAGGSHIIFFER